MQKTQEEQAFQAGWAGNYPQPLLWINSFHPGGSTGTLHTVLAFFGRLSAPPTHLSAPALLAAQLPGVCSSGETGLGDALLSSLPEWASQVLGPAEILVWGSPWVPWSECCSWAERLLGTTARVLQKAFWESDMFSLWDRWPAAPDLATWRLRLSQYLNWREPTLLAYLSPPWMQGISMKSIRRTSTNPRQACASSEEWWNNPMDLGDL